MVDINSTRQATIPPVRTNLKKGGIMENKLRMVSAKEALQGQLQKPSTQKPCKNQR